MRHFALVGFCDTNGTLTIPRWRVKTFGLPDASLDTTGGR
jgi:hypothetical protein